MNATLPVCGPLSGPAQVDDTVAALQAAGVRRRSFGVVDLQTRRGLEPEPGAGWALSAIWRELQRVVVLSFPVAVWVTLDALLAQLGRQLEVEVDRRRHSVNTMPDPVEPECERSEIYIG